jgi:hypothetical protein
MTPRLALAAAALAAIAATPLAMPQVAELQGRAPGKPQRCLGMRPGASFATADADPHILIYDDGKTVWANRLDASCNFDPGETIIADQPAAYYCHGDFVRKGSSRVELNPFGRRCALGNFVPYRTAK